jgi:hypothetical protein
MLHAEVAPEEAFRRSLFAKNGVLLEKPLRLGNWNWRNYAYCASVCRRNIMLYNRGNTNAIKNVRCRDIRL